MILYHASSCIVDRPDVRHSRRDVDFGPGFYMTTMRDQALSWCKRLIARNGQAYINRYTLDEAALSAFSVLRFDSYSEAWLDFVLACRSGRDATTYDIVMGGVANDRVYNTVELYFSGLIDKQTAIGRLRYEKPNDQICIRSQAVLDGYLHFEGGERP